MQESKFQSLIVAVAAAIILTFPAGLAVGVYLNPAPSLQHTFDLATKIGRQQNPGNTWKASQEGVKLYFDTIRADR